ncbi:flagellar brake protein [Thiobacter aerophilum]|uniref:Flagellar brake protein YcgR n=1 Tax=Thiobacter aerophilum TaxID=3121275 RepID=A0ABV0EDX3_9BURK
MSTSENTLLPIDPTHDLGQYWLEARTEVVHILRSLNTHADSLAVYFDQGRHFILTALLDVRPAQETFVFDVGSQAEMNERLLKSERLLFVGIQDGIRVQWSTGPAAKTHFGGGPAFIAWLPQAVLRLQRRDYFRAVVPLSMDARVHLPAVQSGREGLRIHDISAGGVCVIANESLARAQVLDRFDACTLRLEHVLDDLHVAVEVRHITPVNLRGGRVETRVGLRYLDPSAADQARLQRFLVKVEQTKRALVGE